MPDGLHAGEAYWRQRATLARDAERIRMLGRIVGRPGDLWPFQWAQLMAFALELRPDLIVELGRGYGNSTCAFTEVASLAGGSDTRVISLCRSRSWDERTLPALRPAVAAEWLAPLRTLRGDIREWDPAPDLRHARRVLVFWDAHGYDVAEWLFGRVGPLLADREHAILVHDISDRRYQDPGRDAYGASGLWKGYEDGGPRLRIGAIDTAFEEAIVLLDFVSRNDLDLRSAEEEIRTFFGSRPQELAEAQAMLGDLFSLEAGWFWFQLRSRSGRPLTYPRPQSRRRRPLMRRVKDAAKIVLRGEI